MISRFNILGGFGERKTYDNCTIACGRLSRNPSVALKKFIFDAWTSASRVMLPNCLSPHADKMLKMKL